MKDASVQSSAQPPAHEWVKVAFDRVAAVLGLVLLSPIVLIAALVVLIALGRPVFFRQERPGLHKRPFVLYKFRTMRVAVDSRGRPLPDSERMTRLGRFLRKTSIDELPELFNVLRGDMSVVGPRPLLTEYLPLYTPHQARRHEVRPGMTGWAQVNGRNELSWEEKFALDVWYVDHRSLWLDLRILLRTIAVVSRSRGVNQPGQATAQPFKGSYDQDGEMAIALMAER